MAVKKRGISPDLLIHPGETIADLLEERSITQKELAQRTGVSEAFLSDVIHGKKDISKGLAMGLEYALDIPSSFWLNLQANYDAELLGLKEEETVLDEEKAVLKKIHEIVSYLEKRRIIPSGLSPEQVTIHLRKFFQISSLSNLNHLAPAGAFRLSEKGTVDPYVLGAWICYCRALESREKLSCGFDPGRTNQLILEIKKIMYSNVSDPQEPLRILLSGYGIDFHIVHNFKGAPVHGYISKKDDGTYRMVLTLRGAYADIFWFSLFHELGHIVNGDVSKAGNFIDVLDSRNDKKETAADSFAANALLDATDYCNFLMKHDFSILSIKSFSDSQGVPAFIVIGRVQKEKIILWNLFASQKPRYKWAE